MEIPGLNLSKGTWLMANCGRMKSENNCHIIMMAPESQQSDLLEAAVAHAVKTHGHEDSDNLRKQISYHMFEKIQI